MYVQYKIIIDLQIGRDFDEILYSYGLNTTTIFCLEYLKQTKNGSVYGKSNELTTLITNLTHYIENESKKEYPELWI